MWHYQSLKKSSYTENGHTNLEWMTSFFSTATPYPLTQFYATILILYLPRLSDVFRGFRKKSKAWSGFITFCPFFCNHPPVLPEWRSSWMTSWTIKTPMLIYNRTGLMFSLNQIRVGRCAIRTQSNIYDGAFLRKYLICGNIYFRKIS